MAYAHCMIHRLSSVPVGGERRLVDQEGNQCWLGTHECPYSDGGDRLHRDLIDSL